MAESSVLLCELADEYFDGNENIDSRLLFYYGNRQWFIKAFLAEYESELIAIITTCKYITLFSMHIYQFL